MGLALLVAIVCVPIVEIYLALQVAHQIGGLATVALLVAVSAAGPWLVKRRGLGVWRRAQARLEEGEVPGKELVDGVLLLAAGVLLTLPGFLTAAVGILLLLPPVRAVLRGAAGAWLVRRARAGNVSVRVYSGGRRRGFGGSDGGQPIDAGAHDADTDTDHTDGRDSDGRDTGGPPHDDEPQRSLPRPEDRRA
jgi:UPF0716 protein FxsA